jgi:hypothetical protein
LVIMPRVADYDHVGQPELLVHDPHDLGERGRVAGVTRRRPHGHRPPRRAAARSRGERRRQFDRHRIDGNRGGTDPVEAAETPLTPELNEEYK